MRKAREPNDKLDRATERTLAEADRKALRGLCQYSKPARYGGIPVFKALKVSVAILTLIRASMGSQWSLFRVDELESCTIYSSRIIFSHVFTLKPNTEWIG